MYLDSAYHSELQITPGTGLVGLVAGLLGAEEVIITDQEYKNALSRAEPSR
jgi:hypothetical protein